jgi:hypothetical protein
MEDKELIKKENIEFFYQNLKEYLKDPKLLRKYLVINNKEVKGTFKKFPEALEYAIDNLPDNEYVIQQVLDEIEGVYIIS